MIQDGYENAVAHDCQANDCVIAAPAALGKLAASAAGQSD
jgi:hypothetical protein